MRPIGQVGKRGGRPTTNRKPLTKPMTVVEAVATLPPSAFRRLTVSEGSQGPIVYEYAELTVWFSEGGLPAVEPERLLVRRSLGQEPEVKYHRTNAPADIPLQQVAAGRALRWTIEQDIQAGKGESGLDEYETRGWTGWHHHTALSLLALLFLVLARTRLGEKQPQMTVREVRALLKHRLDLRRWDEAEILAWSNWRMKRNRIAKLCHEKRRRAELRRRSRKRQQAL